MRIAVTEADHRREVRHDRGRAAKEHTLFSEVSEGFHAYGVGHHRQMAELDQEFSAAAGRDVIVSFTPHLVLMNRGILSYRYTFGGGGVASAFQ
jgi:N-acetyl-gamma-glutamyl-phosphate reductase